MQQLWSAQNKKLTPAGGFYYSLRPWGADAGGQLVRKQYLGRCGFSSRSKSLTDESFAELMALVRTQIGTAVRKFADGHFHITTIASESPCRYCPSSEICRKDIDRAIHLAPKLSGAGA
jgi:hypothetical protein